MNEPVDRRPEISSRNVSRFYDVEQGSGTRWPGSFTVHRITGSVNVLGPPLNDEILAVFKPIGYYSVRWNANYDHRVRGN